MCDLTSLTQKTLNIPALSPSVHRLLESRRTNTHMTEELFSISSPISSGPNRYTHEAYYNHARFVVLTGGTNEGQDF